jgi:hypothetical protein
MYIFTMFLAENESVDDFLTLLQKINQNSAEGRYPYLWDVSVVHAFIS